MKSSSIIPVLASLWILRSVAGDDSLGCYSSIDVAESKGSQTFQTSQTCQESCSDYAYIAIKNGGDCYCLSSKPSSSDSTSSSECNVPCYGYGKQTCGGTSAYNVFAGTGTEGSGSSDTDSTTAASTSATTSSKTSTSSFSSTNAQISSTSDPTTSSSSSPTSTTPAKTTSSSDDTESAARTTVIVTASDTGKGSKTVTTDVAASTSSSSSSTSASSHSEKKTSKSNIGPIVGGVVGGLAGLAIIAAIIFFLIRRRNYDDEEDEEEFYDKNNNTLGAIGLGRGGTGKSSKRTKNPLPLDMPMSNPFDHPSDALANSKLEGGYKNSVDLADPRLNPIMMGRRKLSVGSLADEADYSRKILQVANPDHSYA